MAIYVAKQGDYALVDGVTSTDPTVDDPIVLPPDIPPVDEDDPVLPPGWDVPPSVAMFWAEKSGTAKSLQQYRTDLNNVTIVATYDLTKQAIFQDPTAVVELAAEAVSVDPANYNAGVEFNDADGDGFYDGYTHDLRNVEIVNPKVFNTHINPTVDSVSDSESFQNLSNSIAYSGLFDTPVLFLKGEADNTSTFFVDPAELQSFTGDSGTADVFTEYAAWDVVPVNSSGNRTTGVKVTDIKVQFPRGSWPANKEVSDGGYITNVVAGVDANNYFYIGVQADVHSQSDNSSHDL